MPGIRCDQHRQQHNSYYSKAIRQRSALATRAKPKLLVLYHQLFHGVSEGEMLHEVCEHYSGAVASAHDLDVY